MRQAEQCNVSGTNFVPTKFKIMKRIILTLALCFAAAATLRAQTTTIANLESSIDRESTAISKYKAYSDKASAEGQYAVAALFAAASHAASVHADRMTAVLTDLGVKDYKAAIGRFEAGTTAKNLQEAIDSETNASTNVYPGFMNKADAEKISAASQAFYFATNSDLKHVIIYKDVLSKSDKPETITKTFYVCPKCGNIFAGSRDTFCSVCGHPFWGCAKFQAQKPS